MPIDRTTSNVAPFRRRRTARGRGTLVALVFGGVLAVTGCGIEAQYPLAAPTAEEKATPKPSTPPQSSPADSDPSTPEPSLPPMKQPSGQWEPRDIPEPPGDDATTMERLEYELESQVWTAAGEWDETSTDCDIDESELDETGDHEFECTVEYRDTDSTFDVSAESTDTTVELSPEAGQLPLLEKKAVHEVTRQAIDPAKAMCVMDDVELVTLGQQDAIECTVTDVHGESVTYEGELADNGGVFFSAESEGGETPG